MDQDRPIESFDIVVLPPGEKVELDLKELWEYRDLIGLLVRRSIIVKYKQSILGPAWAFIQPVMSAIILAFTFGNLAGLSPDGVPTFLFYLSGQVAWQFFSGCIGTISKTFTDNLDLMSKVYFPRFAIPVASVLSQLINLVIKCCIFIVFYLAFHFGGSPVLPDRTLALVPLYLLHLGILGLGTGALLSSFTTKYRDVIILVDYGVSLWMYITPILYDFSTIPASVSPLFYLNPLTPIFIHLQTALFGGDVYCWNYYLLSLAISIIMLIVGHRVFNRSARTFLDTI